MNKSEKVVQNKYTDIFPVTDNYSSKEKVKKKAWKDTRKQSVTNSPADSKDDATVPLLKTEDYKDR